MKTKSVIVNLPLTAFRCLYATQKGKKIVCEIDIDSLKKVNEPSKLDDMIAEARLEYSTGKTKGFTDAKKLTRYLNS